MEKLRQFLKNNGLTQQAFGELIGVPQTTIASWLSGKAKPKHENLIKISEVTGIRPEELLETHLEGFIQQAGPKYKNLSSPLLIDGEEELLDLYRQLDQDDRADLRATARVLLRHEKYAQPKGKKVA